MLKMNVFISIVILITIGAIESKQSVKKSRSSNNNKNNHSEIVHSDNLIFLYQLNNGQNFNVIDKTNQISLINENTGKIN